MLSNNNNNCVVTKAISLSVATVGKYPECYIKLINTIMDASKINEGSSVVLLQMDPVFLYNIPNKSLKQIHRASDWNISAPDWYGKLLVTEIDSDSCQVQFKNTNEMFGLAVITKRELSSSQVFQKVKDSSRYCTVQIQNIVSGDSTVYGIGFMHSKDMSILLHCLQDYFRPQNESLVGDDVCIKYTEHAHAKPDVADGFTNEIKCTDYEKVQADVKNEATKDVKYTEQAPVKVDVKGEITKDILCTAQASIKLEFKDVKCTTQAPIKVDVKDKLTKNKKYAGHAQLKMDIKGETTKDMKYTAHASIKMDVKGETTKDVKHTGHAPIRVDVKDEITKDVKYTAHAPIKTHVKDEIKKDVKCAGHAPIELDVKELRYAGHPENNVEVDIKDGITKDSKCTGGTSVIVNVSCNLHKPAKAKEDVKIEQSNEINSSEHKSIKLDTKMEVTKKKETHQITLPLKVNIKDAKICETPNSKKSANEISKTRKLQRDSESDEDQIEVNKSTSNTVTEELDEVMDSHSDINDNGFLYEDSVTKWFTCHLCLYTSEFRNKMNFLLIHWASTHKIKKPNICKLCNLVFLTAEHRAKHITTRHKKMCSFCAIEFDTKSKLQSHLKELHDPNVNNDNNIENPDPEPASNQTTHNQDVNNRNNINLDPTSVPATHGPRVAPTVLNTPTSLDEEETEVGIPYHDRDTQQLMCPFCPFLAFPLKNQFKFLFQHWKEVHNINEPHTCNFCYLNFSTAAHRLKHITALHQVCRICSWEFGRLGNLNQHLKSVHHLDVSNPSISVQPKKAKILIYKCMTCSLEFETECYLRFHSEAHVQNTRRKWPNKEGNSFYLCDVCGRNFDSEEILEIHLIRAHDKRTG